MADSTKDAALPGAPPVHKALLVAALLSVGAVVTYGVVQLRAAPERELALAFLRDVQQDAPAAVARADGDAQRALAGEHAESTPGLGAARDSRSFQSVSTTVEWGARCVEVNAYGTVRYKLYVELLEGARGFRVTRVLTTPPYSGPCSGD